MCVCVRSLNPLVLLLASIVKGRKEGNILFSDALKTFYLRLYGVRHMVKDHSDSEKGNPLPPHKLLFPNSSRVLLYASSHRRVNTYHGLCYASRGALAGTRNNQHCLQLMHGSFCALIKYIPMFKSNHILFFQLRRVR